jgi:hypothetical protein
MTKRLERSAVSSRSSFKDRERCYQDFRTRGSMFVPARPRKGCPRSWPYWPEPRPSRLSCAQPGHRRWRAQPQRQPTPSGPNLTLGEPLQRPVCGVRSRPSASIPRISHDAPKPTPIAAPVIGRVGWQTDVRRTHPVTCRERSRMLSFNLNPWSPSQVGAVSGCNRLNRSFTSRSGFTSAMAMAPPTSIMTPHMKKPVLNPSSGVVALSITLPMI